MIHDSQFHLLFFFSILLNFEFFKNVVTSNEFLKYFLIKSSNIHNSKI